MMRVSACGRGLSIFMIVITSYSIHYTKLYDIKQVVEELKQELPSLKTFVTLSPVPGFMRWLAQERGKDVV